MRILGLRAILGDGEAFEIVLLSGGVEADMAGLDLALIDSSATPHLFELLGSFRRLRPQLRLIVLGAETDLEHVTRIIGTGAKGYLNHWASERELRTAIAVVRDGSVWAPRKALARLLESTLEEQTATTPGEVRFTKREVEVLRLLTLGQPNRQIASTLGVDEGTVKAHMGRLMRKAGVDNRTALSMRAIERQWAAR
jgi:DNA-binding NarL/FixJ family response regulator